MLTDLATALSVGYSYLRGRWLIALAASHLPTAACLPAARPLTNWLARRNLRGPKHNLSAVLVLSGIQDWFVGGLEDELAIPAGVLFVAFGFVGAWVGRRLFV